MPQAWTVEADRAMLLALVQVVCEEGISKSQTDAAAKKLGDKWTSSAIAQHYNKKLKGLSAKSLANGGDGSASDNECADDDDATTKGKGKGKAGAAPKKTATAKKGKAAAAASSDAAAAAADDDEQAVDKKKRKKPATPAKFPNLKRKAGDKDLKGGEGKAVKVEDGEDEGEVDADAEGEEE